MFYHRRTRCAQNLEATISYQVFLRSTKIVWMSFALLFSLAVDASTFGGESATGLPHAARDHRNRRPADLAKSCAAFLHQSFNCPSCKRSYVSQWHPTPRVTRQHSCAGSPRTTRQNALMLMVSPMLWRKT